MYQFCSVQFSHSVVSDSATPWTEARQASLSITNSWSLLKTHVHWVGDAIQPSHPLSSPSLAFKLSQHQVLQSFHIRWPKYWSLSFSISPSNEYSRLIPLGWTGWISLHPRDSQQSSPTPQFKSINSSALSWRVMVQLSHAYMAAGKTIALTRQTFVNKVMSLLFNMLSKFVIAFLSRSKCFLIS